MIALPLTIQILVIFSLGYLPSKVIKLPYIDAAPSSMIGASNHFEVAIATAVTVFGIESGAALSAVVGVLIEVPVMLFLVSICLKTRGWFAARKSADEAVEVN
jgi:arsenite transporter